MMFDGPMSTTIRWTIALVIALVLAIIIGFSVGNDGPGKLYGKEIDYAALEGAELHLIGSTINLQEEVLFASERLGQQMGEVINR